MSEKKLILAVTEEEIKAAIIAKAQEYKEHYKGQKLFIVAELSGVFVFLADFLRELPIDVSIKFVAIKKKDDEKNITFDLGTGSSFEDENVLIVTDVYNHGNTLTELVQIVNDGKPKSVRVLALVNRIGYEKNKTVNVEYLFMLNNQRIVGYGLAEHESYRGLKSLYYIEAGEGVDE